MGRRVVHKVFGLVHGVEGLQQGLAGVGVGDRLLAEPYVPLVRALLPNRVLGC